MKYEKTQKGNPYELPIKQHILPYKSINRFINSSGFVDVFLKDQNKKIFLKPNDQLFCVKRLWDKRSETGFMKDIEDNFQRVVDEVITSGIFLSDLEHKIISSFYILLYLREKYSRLVLEDQKIEGAIDVTLKLSKDEQEMFEHNKINFIKPDLTIPSRQLVGIRIQLELNQLEGHFSNIKWSILKTDEEEFIVPDNFSSIMIIPITPTLFLAANQIGKILSTDEITKINRFAISRSKNYYFARNLNQAPGFNN